MFCQCDYKKNLVSLDSMQHIFGKYYLQTRSGGVEDNGLTYSDRQPCYFANNAETSIIAPLLLQTES
jgi:hypothetical protein